jgi:hypothetical protein
MHRIQKIREKLHEIPHFFTLLSTCTSVHSTVFRGGFFPTHHSGRCDVKSIVRWRSISALSVMIAMITYISKNIFLTLVISKHGGIIEKGMFSVIVDRTRVTNLHIMMRRRLLGQMMAVTLWQLVAATSSILIWGGVWGFPTIIEISVRKFRIRLISGVLVNSF